MSASHSLIALVNQLQAMESSLASIMFESVAKLSSLTSSSVFLLIETDDGNRRFSGAQHLKDAFLNGALAATPKDMQINVDLNLQVTEEVSVSSLRPAFPANPLASSSSSSMAFPSHSSPFSPQPPHLSFPQSSPHRKSSSSTGVEGHGRKRSAAAATSSSLTLPSTSTSDSASSSTTPKRRKEVEAVSLVKEEEVEQKPVIEGPSLAIDNSDAKEEQQQQQLQDNISDDGDSDIEILDSFFDDSSMGGGGGGGNGTGDGGGNNGDVGFGAVDVAGSSMSFLHGESGSGSLISNIPCNQKKVEALRSIQDPMRAFQKGTVECRLLASVSYDFGKELQTVCPHPMDSPLALTFFRANLTQFVGQFPNLGLDNPHTKNHKIEVGQNILMKPYSFVMKSARNGFYRDHYKIPRTKSSN